MCDSLVHRGPDSDGVWQDPDMPLVLAHKRLAIIDLSPEGHQPMESSSGRYMIAFNGEIYNFRDLSRELKNLGVSFRGRSDTEVILEAIEIWGLNLTIQKLNGMFAFILWDRKEREIHFVRDRMGKKPLYLGWAGKNLVFGSELKALRVHPAFETNLNKEAVALYMRYGYVPAPHTIYQNVWMLMPGSRLSFKLENIDPGETLSAMMKPYWNHLEIMCEARLRSRPIKDAEAIDAFENLLSTCVQDRMISDVPLGAFLSGGIDSSVVVALMQKYANGPVKTYAIGFEEAGFDEAAHAKKVAGHIGTDHHELYLKADDALDLIPKIPHFYDEPFADISSLPTYLVSQFARKDVTVALSGDGGDEMLGGYNRHVNGPKIWNKMRCLPKAMRSALAGFIQKTPPEKWSKIIPQRPQFGELLHKAADVMALEDEQAIYTKLISRFENPSDILLEADEPYIPLTHPEWHPDEDMSFSEKMMYWDSLSYLPGDILTKVDRASMAVSIEARAPLLDKRIYEYVWSLPDHLKIRGGKGKWLLREVLARHVPRNLFERPKQGFSVPVASWLRGSLQDWAEDLLDEQSLKADGLFKADAVRQIWAEHLDGNGHHGEKLWAILMFQSWKKEWM